MARINVGCGMTPTAGWVNVDNSLSIRLASLPNWIVAASTQIGLIDRAQRAYIGFCRRENIGWCNAVKRLPCKDESVEVLYSSHMLEHLDQQEAHQFLKEAYRVLQKGGVMRLAVPDLGQIIRDYVEDGNGDRFMESLHTCVPKPKSFRSRLKLAMVGPRQHHWMYDEASLCSLLKRSGFQNARALKAGETTIPDPGPLNLAERQEESIYVEAVK
ncbi:MAG: methyltransferase domain-containing protein [Candidatus Competibacteraceae bacterium]